MKLWISLFTVLVAVPILANDDPFETVADAGKSIVVAAGEEISDGLSETIEPLSSDEVLDVLIGGGTNSEVAKKVVDALAKGLGQEDFEVNGVLSTSGWNSGLGFDRDRWPLDVVLKSGDGIFELEDVLIADFANHGLHAEIGYKSIYFFPTGELTLESINGKVCGQKLTDSISISLYLGVLGDPVEVLDKNQRWQTVRKGVPTWVPGGVSAGYINCGGVNGGLFYVAPQLSYTLGISFPSIRFSSNVKDVEEN